MSLQKIGAAAVALTLIFTTVVGAGAQSLPADCTDGDPAYFETFLEIDAAIVNIDEQLQAGTINPVDAEKELAALFAVVVTLDPPTVFEDAHDAYEAALHYYSLGVASIGFGQPGLEIGMSYINMAYTILGSFGELATTAVEQCGGGTNSPAPGEVPSSNML